MQRSEQRILTTHAGSLPRPAALTRLFAQRVRGEATIRPRSSARAALRCARSCRSRSRPAST